MSEVTGVVPRGNWVSAPCETAHCSEHGQPIYRVSGTFGGEARFQVGDIVHRIGMGTARHELCKRPDRPHFSEHKEEA